MQQGAHIHDGKPEPLHNRKMLKLVLICNHILIANMTKVDIIASMNSKHRKTLEAIFSKPIPSTLEWVKVEALLVAVGCDVLEGRSSRVRFVHGQHVGTFHRPHPAKEAKPYQVNDAKAFLELIGVKP